MITKEMEVVLERTTDTPSAITDLSAGELAYRIRAREISAQEVIEAHIRRIEEVDGKLNAVVIRTFDDARARAAEADRAIARGEALGPLHGVPVTIKEQFRVAGTEVTIGLPGQVGRVYKPTVRWSRSCERRGPSSSARPTCRNSWLSRKWTARSTGGPTTPGTWIAHRAAAVGAKRPSLPRVARPWGSVGTWAAASGCRPTLAASTA